jgi:hypothetical protein
MKRRRIRRALTIVLAVALVLIGANVVTGTFLLPETGSYPTGLFIDDAARGLAAAPHFSAVVTRAGVSFPVAINNAGYRDAEWVADGRPRILLVGSSATFGVGLPREAGIAAKLAEALGPTVSVLNAGIYSYGPPQILRTIEMECPALKPRLVLYLHEYKATRRDFMAERRPSPESEASAAAREEVAPPDWDLSFHALRAFLSGRGLHPRQLGEELFGLARLPLDYLQAHYAMTLPSAEFPIATTEAAARTILAMREAATACSADFAMAVLAGPAEAFYGMREPATDLVLRRLAEAAQPLGIVDTRIGIPLGSRFAIPGLDYPNEAGAAWIAADLAPFVRSRLAEQ